MTNEEIKIMASTCNNYYNCGLCPYNPEDISRFIGDRWKGGCPDYDRKLVYAMGKGYGNVSEYEAEREMLGSQIKVLKQRLNDKYIEIDNLNRDYRNAFERLKSQQQEIDGLRAENACLLKACEEQFTFDTTENRTYSIFNSVRKEFAEKLKKYSYTDNCFTDGKWHRYVLVSDIDELLKEYE